jgi:hypothetical protein
MSPLLEIQQLATHDIQRYSAAVELGDGEQTTIHVVRYPREVVRPRVVCFEEATRLLDWCEINGQTEAMVGGFFLRTAGQLLGEVWVDGVRQAAVPIDSPFAGQRAALSIDGDRLRIGARLSLAAQPQGDLLQAGPLLVANGAIALNGRDDPEGLTTAALQFDTDISQGRYPRTAIGYNDSHIFSVVCDGYPDCAPEAHDVGLTLQELAEAMILLGAQQALNLDGGGSSTQVSDSLLRNHSRGDGREYPRGREVWTAIVFEPSK